MAGCTSKGWAQTPLFVLISAGLLLAACLCLSAAWVREAAIVTINPDERGVVISALQPQGYRPQTLSPGQHWIVPFAERVQIYPLGPQTYATSATPASAQDDDPITTRTSDGQGVVVDVLVTYSIQPMRVIEMHVRWQDRYSHGVVRPQTRDLTHDAIVHYTAEELMGSKRALIEARITTELRRKLDSHYLDLHEFVIQNVRRAGE